MAKLRDSHRETLAAMGSFPVTVDSSGKGSRGQGDLREVCNEGCSNREEGD